MGDKTKAQLTADLVDLLEQNDRITATFLDTVLNQAYKYICRPGVYDHPELQLIQDIPFVAATAEYTVSTRLVTIMHDDGVFTFYGDGRRTRMKRASFARLMEDANLITGSEGIPSRYARRNRTLYINVFPGSELLSGGFIRLPYRGRPLPLTADGQFAETDDIWDQVITHLAASFGWARLGQQQRSDFYRDFAISMGNSLGATLDMDATDPGEGFEIEDGNSAGDYVDTI